MNNAADFNQLLERIGGDVEVLDLTGIIYKVGDEGVSSLSTALVNENNKVTWLSLSSNKIGDDGVRSLSTALMNENNKLTRLNLGGNNYIGDDGARSLSMALMNENNKVTALNLSGNTIRTPGLLELLKSCRFSVVSHLQFAIQKPRYSKANTLQMFSLAFNEYIPRLVCLASVRTIPRIGDQSPHFRMLSSDILIRIVQTLGWFINLKQTISILEEHAD